MFCTNCGATVPADGKFCGGCGRAVQEVSVSTIAEPNTGPQPEAATPAAAVDSPWVGPKVRHEEGRSTTPRPWLRFWAKLLDVLLWTIVLGILVAIMFPRWSAETHQTLVGLILMACAVPIQAVLLASFGTTVGKALFDIKVTHNGRRLTFGQALRREAMCFLKGFGLGLPIVYLFTLFAAYGDLKKSGSSSWDRDNGNVVTHKDPSVTGVIGAVVILGLSFAAVVWGNMLASQGY